MEAKVRAVLEELGVATGSQVRKHMESRGENPSVGSVWATLDRMEENGTVWSELTETRMKAYRLTGHRVPVAGKALRLA